MDENPYQSPGASGAPDDSPLQVARRRLKMEFLAFLGWPVAFLLLAVGCGGLVVGGRPALLYAGLLPLGVALAAYCIWTMLWRVPREK